MLSFKNKTWHHLHFKVSRYGEIVEVVVLRLPRCTDYRNNFVTFEYKDREYRERVKCQFLDQVKVDNKLEMLHLKNTSTFLFKEENVDLDILANLFLAFVGLTSIIISVRKKK